MEPGEEEGQQFDQLYNQEAMGLGLADISGERPAQKESSGKGKGGKDNEGQEEGEEEEGEDTLKEALKKARRARDQVASLQSDLEEALGKASSRLSPKGKAGAQGWSTSLSKMLAQLKTVLNGKKEVKPQAVKQLLEETAKVVKGAKE